MKAKAVEGGGVAPLTPCGAFWETEAMGEEKAPASGSSGWGSDTLLETVVYFKITYLKNDI